MYRVRERLGRSSRLGAIALLTLSSILVILSYKYPNIIVEIDSVVAFAAAIVLIYKDTTRSVQLRVVERALESFRELILGLISRIEQSEISRMYFSYVQTGSRITDVVLVARFSDELEQSNASDPPSYLARHKEDDEATQSRQIPSHVLQSSVATSNNSLIQDSGLVPPGRSLAELFAREMALESPRIDDIITRAPLILTEALGLASAASVIKRTDESIELNMLHPILKKDCFQSRSGYSRTDLGLGCMICSMFAVLICYTSGREVRVISCEYDQETDSAKIEFQMVEKKSFAKAFRQE
jgi:hypothetical protein